MNKHFDVMIVGLGANGSAAAWHLSKTGISVGGIDRFHPPHQHGSSHGQSRIIRQAYFENPFYVPFLKEAYAIWDEISSVSGKTLFLKTGGIMLGAKDSELITGSMRSAHAHGIASEFLDREAIPKRIPAFRPDEEMVGVFERDAGILFPEACIAAFLEQADANGAHMHYNEQVMKIIPHADAVEIVTDRSTYRAARLIVSTGAWLAELMPDLDLPLRVERQVLHWFKNRDPRAAQNIRPEHLPIFIVEHAPGKRFYGFPDLGDGIKIAFHHAGREIHPDDLRNDVSPEEVREMMDVVKKYFDIDAAYNYSTTCMYTNTPDEHFIIALHPAHSNICIASPCSGHGFKFASVTGKILGDLVLDKEIPFDLSPFRITRFKTS